MEVCEDIAGWVSTVLTVCYYIPHLLPFIRIYTNKLNFEDSPGTFITICYCNCFLWYVYSDAMIFSDPLKYCYTICGGICVLSMIIYLLNEIKKYIADTILNISLIIAGSFSTYNYLVYQLYNEALVGRLCAITSFFIALNPIFTIYRVLKEKNFYLIQIYQSSFYFLSSISWVIYGIIFKDFYISFAHCFGAIISFVEIIIYLTFKNKYPGISEKNFSSTIGIETTGNEEIKKEEKNNDDNQTDIKEIPTKVVKIVSKT